MADIIFNKFIHDLGSGLVNWTTDTLRAALYSDLSSFTKDTTVYTNTNELSSVNGYTQNDKAVTGATLTQNDTDDVVQFDIADITWTASGGAIGPASGCLIYDATNNSGCVYLIDFAAAKTADSGTDFKITIDASGLFIARQQ
jgi:hypothetical protein